LGGLRAGVVPANKYYRGCCVPTTHRTGPPPLGQ